MDTFNENISQVVKSDYVKVLVEVAPLNDYWLNYVVFKGAAEHQFTITSGSCATKPTSLLNCK